MHQFAWKKTVGSAKSHLSVIILVCVFGYMSAYVFFSQIWVDYNLFLHSIIEAFGISLMLLSFVHIWNTYAETVNIVKLVGFGSLLVVLINLPHSVNFAYLLNMHEALVKSYLDNSLKYEVLVAYIEAFLWLFIGLSRRGLSISRWIMMLLSLGIAALLLTTLVRYAGQILSFYSDLHINAIKQYSVYLLSFTIFVALAVYAAKMKSAADDREKVVYDYLILSLHFFILSRIYFALSWGVTTPVHFLAHIFKAAYYFSIYYGVYKATIEYPYIQVRKIKDFYEKLIDTSPVGIITFNADMKISYANKSCDSLFGYGLRELYGTALQDLLESILIFNSDKAEVIDCLRKLQAGSIAFYGQPVFSQKSGCRLIFKATKLKMGTVLVVRDAKKAQAIENMELQAQTILDATDNAIFLLDKSGKVIMCNRKFMEITNKKNGEVIGLELAQLHNLLTWGTIDDMDKCSYDEVGMKGEKWSIATKDGSIKRISFDSSPIYDIDNDKIGWIIIGKDMTDYEKEQEKLIHREKMAVIGQMAAGLVHEIKNPLSSIKGLCQMMLTKQRPEKAVEYAAVMERAVDDISEIVTGFLQFSKPATGEISEAGINSLINSLEILVSTNGYNRGVKTKFCYSDSEEPVRVSSQQIKNAVLGLVDNALDAMNGALDPKLVICTEHDKINRTMSISIKDNGIGMTEEQLALVGTPFYTTKPKGTGLGVSGVKQIVSFHGGALRIASNFGEGAEFTIVLPCTGRNNQEQ